VVADAWFGNKSMMRVAKGLGMIAILRMKRGKTKYRVEHGNGYKLLDAKELYKRAVRMQWNQVADLPWKAVEMVVEIDLSTGGTEDFNPLNRDRAFGEDSDDVFMWAPGDGNDFFDGSQGNDVVIVGFDRGATRF